MSNKNIGGKEILVGVLAVLAIVFGVSFLKQTTVINQVSAPEQTQQSFGSTPGNDINSPYQCVNGVCAYYYSSGLRSSSANLCIFKSPNATTTLPTWGATFSVKNTASSNTFQIGQSWTAGATTTLLASVTVAASLYGNTVATTSMTALTDGIVSPNTFISFNVASGTPTTVWPAGKCNLTLKGI